jgi:predicted O-linked N-acetylglucosamine transferase (SPINDLY family)
MLNPTSNRQASQLAQASQPAKAGRNDPCPCGRGLKFKHCCGRPAARNGSPEREWCDEGRQLLNSGRVEAALEVLRRALARDRTLAEAHANLGVALQVQGRRLEALASYHNAMMFGRGTAVALAAQANYAACVSSHQSYLFDLLRADAECLDSIFTEPVQFGRLLAAHMEPSPPHTNSIDPQRTLRVGYLSPDFRRHSVAYFMEPIVEQHDRGDVHSTCYYTCPQTDSVTERFRSAADEWVHCPDLTPESLALRIRADRIDILVDLAGNTLGNRLLTLARKPAPIQISYLGYPATTGLPTIDYRLSDSLADPADGAVDAFVERALHIAPSMLVYRPPFGPNGLLGSQWPAARPARASDSGPTFGCFNSASKWSAATLAAWAQLLGAVPDSRLMLKSTQLGDPNQAAQVRARLEAAGIERHRVSLHGRDSDPLCHLERYNEVDVSLDTFPYNGVTTSLESIWMGVPFVTLGGTSLPSRMGVSIATNVGHPQWIARSPDEYVRIAAELALSGPRLLELQSTLRAQLEQSPLMDAAGFTRKLEAAYRSAWIGWCARRSLP